MEAKMWPEMFRLARVVVRFIFMLNHLLVKNTLSAYYVSGTILGFGDTVLKMRHDSFSHGASVSLVNIGTSHLVLQSGEWTSWLRKGSIHLVSTDVCPCLENYLSCNWQNCGKQVPWPVEVVHVLQNSPVVRWMVVPQIYVHILTPRTCDCDLIGKEDFCRCN